MTTRVVDRWLPDRPATWSDALIAGLGVLLIAQNFVTGDIERWSWVGVGALLTLIIFGPIASTSAGIRIATWFRAVGFVGQAALVLVLWLLLLVVVSIDFIPSEVALGVLNGVFVGTITYVIAHIVHSGEIQGWRPNYSR